MGRGLEQDGYNLQPNRKRPEVFQIPLASKLKLISAVITDFSLLVLHTQTCACFAPTTGSSVWLIKQFFGD